MPLHVIRRSPHDRVGQSLLTEHYPASFPHDSSNRNSVLGLLMSDRSLSYHKVNKSMDQFDLLYSVCLHEGARE